MEICPGCKTPVRFWHKKCEGNTSWHDRCMIAASNAHDIALHWSNKECAEAGLPSPWELYLTKGSIGERYGSRMDKLLEKYGLKEWWYKRRNQ